MNTTFTLLLDALREEQAQVPDEDLAVLSDLDSEMLEQFLMVWEAMSVNRRQQVIKTLGDLEDEHFELTFEKIHRRLLSDPDPVIRETAISNLWECEDPALVPDLVKTLQTDTAPQVRAAASRALGSFMLLAELSDFPEELHSSMQNALMEAMGDTESDAIPLSSLESLGYSSNEEMEQLIVDASGRPEEAWQKAAIIAMGRSANPHWEPDVVQALTSPSPVVRAEATKAAGELELRSSVPVLIEALDDVNVDVRRNAIWALGQIGGDAASDALRALADEEMDPETMQILDESLDHLVFVEGAREFIMLQLDDPEDDPS